MRHSRWITAAPIGTPLWLADSIVQAASFSGSVGNAKGLPVSGTLVTVFAEDPSRRQTVFTDEQGSYRIQVPYSGKLKLRVRSLFYEDVSFDFAADGQSQVTQDVVLDKVKDIQKQSDTPVSSAHSATLTFEDERMAETFRSQCNYCHQIGNSLTRRPRDKAAWEQTVDRMEGYLAMVNPTEKKSIAKTLFEGFQGKPVANVQNYEYSPELARAKVEEWSFGDGLAFPHDAEYAHDGNFYAADEGHDVIWEIEPDSGKVTAHKLPEPPGGMPEDGKFSGVQLPIGVFNGKHGPRRLRFGRDGIMWIPAFDQDAIMRFDPKTRAFKTYKMPTLAPNEWETPYALNVHQQTGNIWITSNTSDRLFCFDPKSEKFTAFPLPSRVTWMRDPVFLPDGRICNSSSNLPAYAIEDGRPSIVCIDPDGGACDREGPSAP